MALFRRHPVGQGAGRSVLSTFAQQRVGSAADEIAARQVFGPAEITSAMSTGWLSPTGASGSWTNLSNFYREDGANATQVIGANAEGGGFYVYGFPFNLPAGARIKGIHVRFKGRVSAGSIDYAYSFLARHPTFQPNSVSSYSVPLTGSESTVYLGGPNSLWGNVTIDPNSTPDREWLVSDFDGSFGVFAAFGAGASGATVAIDIVQVNVDYWPPLVTGYASSARANQQYDIETQGAAGSQWTSWSLPVNSIDNNTIPWENPTNVQARDGAYAIVTSTPTDDNSMYSVWNAADIPAGATLNGIQLRIRGYSTGASNLSLYLYNFDDTKIGHVRTINLDGSIRDHIAGHALDLFLPMGAGSNFVADDFRSNGWNVLFGEDTDGITTAIDSIEGRFNYSTASTTYLDTAYSNGGTGAQSYGATYRTTTPYGSDGAGPQTYAASYRTTTAYESSGSGAQSYSTSWSAATPYAGAGAGAQSYGAAFTAMTPYAATHASSQDCAAAFRAITGYSLDASGTITYATAYRAATPYSQAELSVQSYGIEARTFSAYSQDIVGTQSYSAQIPGPFSTPYSIASVGAQSYASQFWSRSTYGNEATAGQSYGSAYRTHPAYLNEAVIAQIYRAVVAAITGYSNAAVAGQAYESSFRMRTGYSVAGALASDYGPIYRTFTPIDHAVEAEQDVRPVFWTAAAYASDAAVLQEYRVRFTSVESLPDRLLVTVEWDEWETTPTAQVLRHRTASLTVVTAGESTWQQPPVPESQTMVAAQS